MADDDEDAIDVDRLEGWDAPSAPTGFADRVTEAWLDERRAVARTRSIGARAVAIVAASLVLALGLGLWWTVTRGETAAGELRADGRASTELGAHAVAVAEPGAELRWRVAADGRTHVDQSRGVVFYRVERGTPFEVTTPYGSVRVTGTCFMVEVEDMDRSGYVKAAAVGAVLAAGVVVTVYEGGVVLARDGREVALAAGERGRADTRGPRRTGDDEDEVVASAPTADDAALASADPGELAARVRSQARELDRLRTAEAEQRAEIQRLQSQVQALGGTASASEVASAKVRRCAEGNREAEGCSFVDADQETLVEMARCSIIKADVPNFLYDADESAAMPKEWLERAGLPPGEADGLTAMSEKFRDEYTDALVKLYADAGGDPELADGMPSRSLEGMIEPLLDRSELQRARTQLSRERAGLVDPLDASGMTPADRYVRQVYDVGARFEAKVAETFGPERAHALRLTDNGWPGGSSVQSGTCEE